MGDLRVRLYVYEPSDVELDAREKVQMHRLAYSDRDGFSAEKHGGLLRPGTSRLRLETGVYHFRTLDDAALRIAAGGRVTVLGSDADAATSDPKDPWPKPPPPPPVGAFADTALPWETHGDAFISRGDGPRGRVPVFTVVYEHGAER